MCEGVLGKGTFGDQWIYYSKEGSSCKGELGNKGRGKKLEEKVHSDYTQILDIPLLIVRF